MSDSQEPTGESTTTDTLIDQLLARISIHMDLDRETEQDVLAEIRDHLAESAAKARHQGLSEADALHRAAARFGVEEEIGRSLQATHVGWGTSDAVVAAALPVLCTLCLRWLVFAPDGTALGWPELLSRPAFWILAVAALAIPILKFERRHYALVTWVLFWGLTVAFVTMPALHW